MVAVPKLDLATVVEARGLRKCYGGFVAVDGIDFRVHGGECFGFLGANGAGKTSTLRMVQAVSPRSQGMLTVFGLDPERAGKQIRARLGVCGQEDSLDPDLNVLDNLLVYGSYFAQPRRETRQRARELLEFVSLTEKAKRGIRELSGGMKRRLMVARALIHEPELVVLDEPTTGLDPQGRHLIWQKLRELKQRGVTMLLTTHYMDEAERLCDRLVIMDRGRILAEDSPRALVEKHVGHEVVELRVPPEREPELLDGLDLGHAPSERTGDTRAFFLSHRDQLADQLVARAREHCVTFLVRNATLEDVFLKLTGRDLNE
jgi:lipooligosaccharide transport system ATP-binding protein